MFPWRQGPLQRWSEDRKHSPHVPVYVPPELFKVCEGNAMEAFLMRAALADMTRFQEQKKEVEWYERKRKRDDTPTYNAKGERVNTPQMQFKEKRTKLLNGILALSSKLNQKQAATDTRIVKKIYFTKEQMASRAYGAILGARGRTHQELEKSTGCKISLMGRGISDQLKNKSGPGGGEMRAGEDDTPHCHITAPDEESLRKCVERVEFIISDRPEAVEFRNEKRKEVAILNGTFREDAAWNKPVTQSATGEQFNPMATGVQRNVSTADDEYLKFANELNLDGTPPPPASSAPPPPGAVPGTR
eukprot:TRINITY_DN27565_c0_g1_i1.p2 TRINITY_DN27565_c0_g1~~TRINITY_DN27565_c0_g1_i1.p2  ORF type:complete len:303 (+),score=111.30 TRINITY_DN27565_c0_g1_i1:60-968(+)